MSTYTLKPGITSLKWPKPAIDSFLEKPKEERTVILDKPECNGFTIAEIQPDKVAAYILDIYENDNGVQVIDIETTSIPEGTMFAEMLDSKVVEARYYLYGMGQADQVYSSNSPDTTYIRVRANSDPTIYGAFIKNE